MATPWDRQKGESSQAFEAFERYRALGIDRSAVQVAKALGKSATLMNRWSSRHQWVERARAWDSHAATKARAEELATRRQQARDDARKYRTLASGLLAKAAAVLKSAEEGGLVPAELKPSDVVAWMRTARELEDSARQLDGPTTDRDGFEVTPATTGSREISIRIIGPGGLTVGPEAVEAVARQILDQPDPK